MGISRTHRRKALWIGALLVALLVTGCTGIKPYEPRNDREEGPEKGLFTGSEGEFVIFRKVDEPKTGSEAGKRSDENTSPVPVAALNHVTIDASDPARSLKFYQELFGLPIVARQGNTVVLRVGDGPQFIAINGTPSKKPGYNHFGLSVDNFNADSFVEALRKKGIAKSDTVEPMHVSVKRGGADGTTGVFLGDPDGLVMQVQDTTYCGGDKCNDILEPAPSKGLLSITDLNHVTVFVSNGQRSTESYQKVFNMLIDTYQGPTPVLRVGSGNQSVVVFDGSSMKVPAAIDHVCFVVDDFDGDRIVKVLSNYGLKPIGEALRATGPLQVYYTTRMPDRGGDPKGTFELYFTDPDGIVVQLQDARYCGGSGYLGDKCGTPENPIGREP